MAAKKIMTDIVKSASKTDFEKTAAKEPVSRSKPAIEEKPIVRSVKPEDKSVLKSDNRQIQSKQQFQNGNRKFSKINVDNRRFGKSQRYPRRDFQQKPTVQKTEPSFDYQDTKDKYKKAFEKELEEIDRKIEEFEKKEINRFQEEEKTGKGGRFKKYVFSFLAIAIFGSAVYAAAVFLPSANIKIIGQKFNRQYVDSFSAGKNFRFDPNENKIPAEVFSQTKNLSFSFPASGRKYVEEKAGGKIVVYNAYSSVPQVLVANTRFQTSDGKIFLLNDKLIVPGAKIEGGKIIPSSVETEVAASSAGDKYNIGVVRFSIPGFAGSPKYEGFYAESKETMTGGFVGEIAYPTEDDVKKAKSEAAVSLEEGTKSFVKSQIPSDFKIIEGAEQFRIVSEKIKEKTDDTGNFSLFLEGEYSVIAFREGDLMNSIREAGRKHFNNENFEIKDYRLGYGAGRADFDKGEVSFAADFEGVFWQPINTEDLRSKAAGKNEAELRKIVNSLPNIEKVVVSFWPFWVKKAPSDAKRIKVESE